MTSLKGIYKCEICGNIIEVLHIGKGDIICCGKEMKICVENTIDASKEKHVPVIEKTPTGYIVRVGTIEHPMEEKHFIEWIELIADGVSYRKFLKPGDKPIAEFCVKATKIEAREYCNLHGLWKSSN
ncbi:MAG: desulfoferrodoxin [Elusimicrobiales bacterium]|nr:desulfoferrodoxin [Elusimicrobiales bacterium]